MKKHTCGYAPLAAILIRDRIAAAFYGEEQDNVQFHHGHTYGGNPIACAAIPKDRSKAGRLRDV